MAESKSPKAQNYIDTAAAFDRIKLLAAGQSGNEIVEVLLEDAEFAYQTIDARQIENAALREQLVLANERASTAERAAAQNVSLAVSGKHQASMENAKFREEISELKATGGGVESGCSGCTSGLNDGNLKELVDFANKFAGTNPTFLDEIRRLKLLSEEGRPMYTGGKNVFREEGKCGIEFVEYVGLFDGMVEKSQILQERIAVLEAKISNEAAKHVYQGSNLPADVDAEIKRLAGLLSEANAEVAQHGRVVLENARLAKELIAAKSDVATAQQEALDLQAQLSAAASTQRPGTPPSQESEEERRRLVARIDTLDDEVTDLVEKLNTADSMIEELENEEGDKKLQDCRDTVRRLEEEKKKKKKTGGDPEQLKALQKQLKDLKEKRAKDKKDLAQALQNNTDQTAETDAEKVELQRLLDECNKAQTMAAATPTAKPAAKKAEVTKLKKEIKALKAERDDFKTRPEDVEQDSSEEAETISELRIVVKDLDKELAKAKRDLKNSAKKSTIAEFKVENTRLSNALEESVATTDRIREERKAAREERNALRIRVQAAEEALDVDSTELQAQLEEARTRLQDAKRNARIAEAAHTNILALNAELTVQRDAAKAQQNSNSDDEETKRLRDEIKAMKQKLEDTRRMLEGSRTFVKAENDRFMGYIRKLRGTLRDAREQRKVDRTALEQAEINDENESERNTTLTARLHEAEANIRRLEEALEDRGDKPEADNAETAELRIQLATAKADIQRLVILTPGGKEFETQRAEIERLTDLLRDCDDARQCLAIAELDTKRLQELHDKNHGPGRSKNVADDCPDQLREYYETEIARLRKALLAKTQISRLVHRIEQLSRELGGYVERLSTARGEIEKLTAQLQEGSPETDDDLKQRIIECNERVEEADAWIKSLRADLEEEQWKLGDANDTNYDHNDEVAALKSLITKLEFRLTDCLEKIPNSDNQKLLEALQESERAEERRQLGRPQGDGLMSTSIELKRAYEKIARLELTNAALYTAEESTTDWKKMSPEEKAAHDAQVEEWQKQVEDSAHEIADLKRQIEELKKENAVMKIQTAAFQEIIEAVARETAKGKDVTAKNDADPEQHGLFDENDDSGEGEKKSSDAPNMFNPEDEASEASEDPEEDSEDEESPKAAATSAESQETSTSPSPEPEEEGGESKPAAATPSTQPALNKQTRYLPSGGIIFERPSTRGPALKQSKPEVQVPSHPFSKAAVKPAPRATKKKTPAPKRKKSQETESEAAVVVERRVTRSSTAGGLKRKDVPEQKFVKWIVGDKRRKIEK